MKLPLRPPRLSIVLSVPLALFYIASVRAANPTLFPVPLSVERCTAGVTRSILAERNTYRAAQYGDLSRPAPWQSPLMEQLLVPLTALTGTRSDRPPYPQQGVFLSSRVPTSALVPYLVANYHGLSCRLRQVCAALDDTLAGGTGASLFPALPLGCSRLALARNRFWVKHPLRGVPLTFGECAVVTTTPPSSPVSSSASADVSQPAVTCRDLQRQILEEERAFLLSLVSYDAAQRASRSLMSPLQGLLSGVSRNLFQPIQSLVRGLGDLHAIPCLQPSCD